MPTLTPRDVWSAERQDTPKTWLTMMQPDEAFELTLTIRTLTASRNVVRATPLKSAAAAMWDARDSIDQMLAAIRAAEQDAAITPEIAAALTGERNRPLVRPKTMPRRYTRNAH